MQIGEKSDFAVLSLKNLYLNFIRPVFNVSRQRFLFLWINILDDIFEANTKIF